MKENLRIALVAHDGRKKELMEWANYNVMELSKHTLYATGTTGKLLKEVARLNPVTFTWEKPLKDKVTCLDSGPLGGDAEIGAMIAKGEIDMLIFFCDNLIVQGHQSDIQGLSRLASLYNIAFATNRTTADMLFTSSLINDPKYEITLPKCIEAYKNRKTYNFDNI